MKITVVRSHKVHAFGGLAPLRGLCGQRQVEVIITRDLRQITCLKCRALKRAERK